MSHILGHSGYANMNPHLSLQICDSSIQLLMCPAELHKLVKSNQLRSIFLKVEKNWLSLGKHLRTLPRFLEFGVEVWPAFESSPVLNALVYDAGYFGVDIWDNIRKRFFPKLSSFWPERIPHLKTMRYSTNATASPVPLVTFFSLFQNVFFWS